MELRINVSILALTITPLVLMNLWFIHGRTMLAVLPTEIFTLPSSSASPEIHFVPFHTPPEHHNKSVSGEAMPGLFYNDRLFLIGARLSTFVYDDQDVFVDLFGFPGDWFVRRTTHEPDIPACTSTNRTYNMLSYQDTADHVELYCGVEEEECGSDDGTTMCGSSKHHMELIPSVSGDVNQNDVTLFWRCNITEHLTKPVLKQAAQENARRALRVTFWVEEKLRVRNSKTMLDLTRVDIPLSTGVVGHAGPHIRRDTKNLDERSEVSSYFLEPNISIGLCVDIYGREVQRYLPEFIQHHKNIGIEQIVLGVDTTMGSDEFMEVQQLLASYIEEGFVMLQATGLNTYFDCYFDFHKIHFYHQCLYHFKGIAQYSATWDVDEYWIPPKELEVTGQHNFEHEHQGDRRRLGSTPPDRDDDSQVFITKSDHSKFVPAVTQDPLWQESSYAESISIQDVMSAVDRYHAKQGCGSEWCYHMFGSYIVHLIKQLIDDGRVYRTHRQVDDFLRRDKKVEPRWQKGIANTRVAMTSGIHLPGSCRVPGENEYYMFGKHNKCFPHRFGPEAYGAMHHFVSQMRDRDDTYVENKRKLPIDEYVALYGATVSKQLDRLYGSGTRD